MAREGRDTAAEFVSIVEGWEKARREQSEKFTMRGFTGFVEAMNALTRRLVAFADRTDPEFWSAVAELANNAQTLTTKGAKILADHHDMTNL